MFERIKDRYEKGFITDDQLEKYVTLGVLTERERNEIKGFGGLRIVETGEEA